jgi:hypothetical protein
MQMHYVVLAALAALHASAAPVSQRSHSPIDTRLPHAAVPSVNSPNSFNLLDQIRSKASSFTHTAPMSYVSTSQGQVQLKHDVVSTAQPALGRPRMESDPSDPLAGYKERKRDYDRRHKLMKKQGKATLQLSMTDFDSAKQTVRTPSSTPDPDFAGTSTSHMQSSHLSSGKGAAIHNTHTSSEHKKYNIPRALLAPEKLARVREIGRLAARRSRERQKLNHLDLKLATPSSTVNSSQGRKRKRVYHPRSTLPEEKLALVRTKDAGHKRKYRASHITVVRQKEASRKRKERAIKKAESPVEDTVNGPVV